MQLMSEPEHLFFDGFFAPSPLQGMHLSYSMPRRQGMKTINSKRIWYIQICVSPGIWSWFAHCPVGWGCRIHWLLLCREVRPPSPMSVLGYDTKQSDGKVLAMLELWGMRSTPSFTSLPGPLWAGVVAPNKGPIYGLNRTNSMLMLNWIVYVNWIAWSRNVFDN